MIVGVSPELSVSFGNTSSTMQTLVALLRLFLARARMLASLIEEAVAVGDLVRLMEFRSGQANLVEITLPDDTPWGGKPVRKLQLPRDAALVTILRGPRVIVPQDDEPLEGGDELLFVAVTEAEEELRQLLLPLH